MVFDNLKFSAQMPRQLALWGKYSEQIEDYTRRGLQQQMLSERGQQLSRMVDPWFYRDRLKMPKLLIHGSNDRYWATDAASLYWDDLRGRNPCSSCRTRATAWRIGRGWSPPSSPSFIMSRVTRHSPASVARLRSRAGSARSACPRR